MNTTDSDAYAAWLETGRLLFARPWVFVRGVASSDAMPAADVAEVAFAGRSNVGKSSLINALTGQTTLARTSNTPGRTRQLNYFDSGSRLLAVDLPGYGYARAPKSEVAAWTRLMFHYLRGRPNLRRAYLLVDARHGLKPADLDTLDLLDKAAVSYQIVLTKCDKLKPPALDTIVAATAVAIGKRPAAHPEIIATSSHGSQGLDILRAEIAALAD